MYYFDWTATSPMSEEAIQEYCDVARGFTGNPSSSHSLGKASSDKLDEERTTIASLLRTNPSNIYFTSGGTESDSIILSSLLSNPSPGEIITTAIEHSAILEYRKTLERSGWKVTVLQCPKGYLSPSTLKEALNDKVRMVSFMKVNNVTGTVLDTRNLVKTVRDYSLSTGRSIHIHCDAVQALGKIDFYPEEEDMDSAAFSAHKFCGPRGVGILYNRNKAISSLSRGGGQEKGLRPGTENLAGICSMRRALQIALSSLEENYNRVLSFRNKIEAAAKEAEYKLISPSHEDRTEFSPYIICISVKPFPSEVFLRVMNDKGFCLSAGSACSSNSRGKAESVLAGMNVDHNDRMSSIRISLGCRTTEDEVDKLCRALKDVTKELGYGSC